ncbi:TPA: hypothetical protein MIQ56_26945, partial [Klebsiella pneumoniae]|nr:hypothetical protein [Klebsiella pneumoniae]
HLVNDHLALNVKLHFITDYLSFWFIPASSITSNMIFFPKLAYPTRTSTERLYFHSDFWR